MLRRSLLALVIAVVTMTAVRLRGSGSTPLRRGGWRELTRSELEDGGRCHPVSRSKVEPVTDELLAAPADNRVVGVPTQALVE